MQNGLPKLATDTMDWEWSQYEPHFKELLDRELTAANVDQWLKDWSHLGELAAERYGRLYIDQTLDTTSEAAKQKYASFMQNVYPHVAEADNNLKKKLLATGLNPEGFAVPLENMRQDADLFREENIPLETEHEMVGLDTGAKVASVTVQWEGEEVTLAQLVPMVKDADRETREKAWRLGTEAAMKNREGINENWTKLIDLRWKIAKNAGKKDFREYIWQAYHRNDYTVEDSYTFQRAIEEAVVPAAARVYERRRQNWGVDTLRPWDVGVDVMRNHDLTGDPLKRAPIRPFTDVNELESKGQDVFYKVDPQLGDYFKIMRNEGLLNLPNYKGKAPGAYCADFPTLDRPFVFMNAVGSGEDVRTLLHECGHAFHVFEASRQPYAQLKGYPTEFAEVASMSMELLASPYLRKKDGGFYTDDEAARSMVDQLEGILIIWPYIALVDAFNHWANTAEDGRDPNAADKVWGELWDRFMVGQDWSGLHEEKVTGWQRKMHPHQRPFYYIEYGLAQLGAVGVWRNSLKDRAKAVADYKSALALGYSKGVKGLFQAAGVKFAFDTGTLSEAVELIESTIERLEGEIATA